MSRSGVLPPGPRLWPTVQTLRHWHDPIGFERAVLERHGEPFTLLTRPVGPVVVVSEPESVHTVLTGDPDVYRAGQANGRILPILDCESVLLLDGEKHRQRRHLLTPAFRAGSVRRLADTVARETELEIRRWPVGKSFALLPILRSITLEVILQAVVDVPDPAVHAELAWQVRRMLGPGSMAALWLSRRHRSWWSPGSVFERHRRSVHLVVGREIERRRRDDARAGDVLDLLVDGTNPDGSPLTDRSICDEVVTLLMAGYETTSTALGWAFERVLRHPVVFERTRMAGGETDFVYLDAVVCESLRSRPPLLDAVRWTAQPVTLGGRSIPTGTTVMVSIPLVHQREQAYPLPYPLISVRNGSCWGGRPQPSGSRSGEVSDAVSVPIWRYSR